MTAKPKEFPHGYVGFGTTDAFGDPLYSAVVSTDVVERVVSRLIVLERWFECKRVREGWQITVGAAEEDDWPVWFQLHG